MTLPDRTKIDRSPSTTEPTVIRRTDADGSTRTIIMTNGGNYNKRIDGNHIHHHVKGDVGQSNYYEGDTHTDNPTSTTQPRIIVECTDANNSSQTITINTEGGNYNEQIEGNYIQG